MFEIKAVNSSPELAIAFGITPERREQLVAAQNEKIMSILESDGSIRSEAAIEATGTVCQTPVELAIAMFSLGKSVGRAIAHEDMVQRILGAEGNFETTSVQKDAAIS